ncbi:hypothetical protein KDW_56790 [Dictyobacter vulcani]|uniref:YcaO domain-containing protein n=1 Tax=Dictyobacter vulcani TaxID=2607529 RepID=A0A5J4KY75_9CHLR|nr:TOMM precursor leader peptide-binding protein [Dictyobacter vulcani]GER91517.1 hypothetical protein KDW_56790 [Dictyobacter vulcani]
MLAEDMRPKLTADSCYIQVQDGVYLRGNHGGLVLKGRSLYRLLIHLTPRLDGKSTLHALTEGLEPAQKNMITKLLEKLVAHHFLQDENQQQASSLNSEELTPYASATTFIGSFQDAPEHHFEQFRNQRLLIIGAGSTFTALIQACLQSGIRHIDGMGDQIDTKASFSPSDPEQTVRLLGTFPWDDAAAMLKTIQTYDTIIALADRSSLARARVLNKLCVEQKRTLMQAIVVDEHAWIGPLLRPDTLDCGGCWECAWLRLRAHHEQDPHYAFEDQAASPDNLSLTPSVAMLLAYRLVFALFTACTHASRTEQLDTLTKMDLQTYLSETHTFLPHSCCTTCQQPITPTATQFLASIQQLQQHPPLQPETFQEQLTRCFDSDLGLFAPQTETTYVQMPLAVQTITITHEGELVELIATNLQTQTAWLQVCQQACAYYASRIVDQRRLLPSILIQQQSLPALTIAETSKLKAPAATDDRWIWALDMHTQQPYLVPAARVFSTSDDKIATGPGVAAGMTWDETISQALLDWSQQLTLANVTQTPQAYRQVDLASTPMTEVGTQFYQLLIAAGCQLTVYDVTGALQIPTFAICSDGQTVAYGTQCTVAEALEKGLQQALQHHQATMFQQSTPTPATVAELPLHLRGNELYVPDENTRSETSSAAWLLQRFQANRLRILTIPLDHDPALIKIMPFSVRLLLTCTNQDDREEWITI